MKYSMTLFILLINSVLWNEVFAVTSTLLLADNQPDGLTLTMQLPPFEVETVQRPENTCKTLQIPEWMQTIETGFPELPTTGTLIQVPAEGKITVHVTEGLLKVIPQYNPCPVSQLSLTAQGQTISKPVKMTELKTVYPKTLYTVSERMMWRDIPVVRLTVNPFQWYPTTQELYYYTDLRIHLQFEENLPRSQKLRSRSANEIYDKIQEQTLVNYVPVTPEIPALRKKVEVTETEDRKTQMGKAIRIEINQTGIYRLAYAELVKAGLPRQNIHPKHLSLTNQGQEVAIKVITAEETLFTEGDAIEFYATNLNTEFTENNVYWLNWQRKGQGYRIAQRDGQTTQTGQIQSAYYEQLHLEENRKLWEQVPEAPREDYWFWQELATPSKNSTGEYEIPIIIPTPAENYPEAIIKVHFQGSTDTPHHTQIALNGIPLSEATWEGYARYTQEMTVPSQQLNADGENTLTLELPASTEEIGKVYLNWVEIAYWRQFSAKQNELTFTLQGQGKQQITVNAFTKPEITLYDITDPYNVVEIQNFAIEQTDKTYQMTFDEELAGEKTYYIATTKQIKQPATLTLWQPSHLQSPKNRADYILITTDEFLPAVTPLTDLRKQQGLRVKTVSVEEIYDEFNDGRVAPNAIKAFLEYAYTNWQSPAPTYILLIGDATIDYRGYLRADKKSRVPAHLLDLEGHQYIIPPSDNWYVSVQGEDVLPEMFIGRIPGDSVETVTRIIEKIVRFETTDQQVIPKILLVADANEIFQNLHEKVIIPLVPNVFTIDKVYLNEYVKQAEDRAQQVTLARQAIIDSINAGATITTYYGHGTATNWSAGSGLFKPEHISELTNEQNLTFLLTMSCINGHFTNPYKASLAEAFITSPTGVIAGMLPSNLSYPSEDVVLSDELFATLFNQPNEALGAITTQAKIAAYQQGTSKELVEIFTFFGDPATTLKAW